LNSLGKPKNIEEERTKLLENIPKRKKKSASIIKND
jgi:hypothetical protein